MLTRRRLLKGFGAFVFTGLATAGYGFGIEPLRTRITRYALTPPNWPRGLKLSIAVLTDIHAGEPFMTAARIRRIAEATNALEPDITLLLGDFTTGHKWRTRMVPADEWADALTALKAPLGIHAVLGNHDWWDDHTAQRRGHGPTISHNALRKAGIPVYDNDAVRLTKDNQPFWLAGLGDQIALLKGKRWNRDRFRGVDDLPGTLAKITDTAPVILLAHEPDIFPRVPDRVALTLSGHTHGGQVRLFGYSPVVPSRFGNRYAYGHIVEDNRHLIVSGGLGCSIMPVRVGCPPEIVHITLA